MPQDSQYILDIPNPFGEDNGGMGIKNSVMLKAAYPKSPAYVGGDSYGGDDATVKALFESLIQVGTVSTGDDFPTANVPTAFSTYDRDFINNADWAGDASFPALPLTDEAITTANISNSYMPNINSPVDADPDAQPSVMTSDQKAQLQTAATAGIQYGSSTQIGTISPAVTAEIINDQVLSTLASLMGSAGSYASPSE